MLKPYFTTLNMKTFSKMAILWLVFGALLGSWAASVSAQENLADAAAVNLQSENRLKPEPGAAGDVVQSPVNTPSHNSVGVAASPIGSSRHLLSVTLGLLVIVGLIFGLSWLVKRFAQGAFAGNQHLRVLATLPLGTRERLLLVDAAGQSILLGVTATSITSLHVFSSPIDIAEKVNAQAGQSSFKTSEFSQKLMDILQQKSAPESSAQNNKSGDNNK